MHDILDYSHTIFLIYLIAIAAVTSFIVELFSMHALITALYPLFKFSMSTHFIHNLSIFSMESKHHVCFIFIFGKIKKNQTVLYQINKEDRTWQPWRPWSKTVVCSMHRKWGTVHKKAVQWHGQAEWFCTANDKDFTISHPHKVVTKISH